MRDSIFVSYSHADRHILEELRRSLASIPKEVVRLTMWDDTRISPSSQWRDEIEEALSTTAAAVLVLSPAFFASNFIAEHELPALLAAAARSEVKIFPLILARCGHEQVTATFQAVNDPVRPLEMLDEEARRLVWARLVDGLSKVALEISDETRIAAEFKRLENDVARVPAVMAVNDKIRRAGSDPAFNEHETYRENTLVFLEGQRCQAISTWLVEQSKREDLAPLQSKAIVRMMKEIAASEEGALQRATELTRHFADETLATLRRAQGAPGDQGTERSS